MQVTTLFLLLAASASLGAWQEGGAPSGLLVDQEAEILASRVVSGTSAYVLVGVRDKARPGYYAGIELVTLAPDRVSDRKPMDGLAAGLRAPVRNAAIGDDGTVFLVLPPAEDAEVKKPRLSASSGASILLDADWIHGSIVTTVAALGSGRVAVGLRTGNDSRLLVADINSGTVKGHARNQPSGYYFVAEPRPGMLVAASALLAGGKNLEVTSTVETFDGDLVAQGRYTTTGWVRQVAYHADGERLSVLSVSQLDRDNDARLDVLRIIGGRQLSREQDFRIAGEMVSGSLEMDPRGGRNTVRWIASGNQTSVVRKLGTEEADVVGAAVAPGGEKLIRVRGAGLGRAKLVESYVVSGGSVRKRIVLKERTNG